MRFERYKVAKQYGNYTFSELSRMINSNSKIKLTNEEYYFLLGRLDQTKSDFLMSPVTKKFYTIGGSENSRFMWKVNGRPNKVNGVYL